MQDVSRANMTCLKKDDREKKPAWKDHRSVNIKFSQAETEKALEN